MYCISCDAVTHNVNTYYYENTTKRCRSAGFHSQKNILERDRDGSYIMNQYF